MSLISIFLTTLSLLLSSHPFVPMTSLVGIVLSNFQADTFISNSSRIIDYTKSTYQVFHLNITGSYTDGEWDWGRTESIKC